MALPLTGNFRAGPEIVAATNAIGAGAARRLRAADASAGEPTRPPSGDPLVELLLTVDDKKGWEAEETELPRLPDDPSSGLEGRRGAPAGRPARASWSTPARTRPRSSCCCAPSPTSTTLERALARGRPRPLRGRRPRLLVPAADRGHALPAGGGRQPARRRGRCSARSPRPPARVLPDTLWLLRRAAHASRARTGGDAPAPRLAAARATWPSGGEPQRGRRRGRRADPRRGAASACASFADDAGRAARDAAPRAGSRRWSSAPRRASATTSRP